ncbi:MAG: formyltransferase family protein [Ferruginibacter sp.]
MRIVLLCSAQANQTALANKIAAAFDLAGIVVEQKPVNRPKVFTFKNITRKVIDKLFFSKIGGAWQQMLQFYRSTDKNLPAVKTLEVQNINDDSVKSFIQEIKPDLVMVSGTTLLRKNILSIPLPIGIVNLHTGLSPYIKGSPNCTNWCIAEKQFHLIGNSIMWIDAGIDSGDLLSTAIVKFTGNESLAGIHIKVMEEAHALYLGALTGIAAGNAKKVKQSSIAAGRTYYSKNWNFKAKRNLLKNLKYFSKEVNTPEYLKKIEGTVRVHAG